MPRRSSQHTCSSVRDPTLSARPSWNRHVGPRVVSACSIWGTRWRTECVQCGTSKTTGGGGTGMPLWLLGGPWLVILMKPRPPRLGDAAVEWLPGCWGDGELPPGRGCHQGAASASRAECPFPGLLASLKPSHSKRAETRIFADASTRGRSRGRDSAVLITHPTSPLCPAAGTSSQPGDEPPRETVPARAARYPAHRGTPRGSPVQRLRTMVRPALERKRLGGQTRAPPTPRLTHSPSAVEGVLPLFSWAMGLGLMSEN